MLMTADGIYALSVMIIYGVWGTAGLSYPIPTNSIAPPGHLLAVTAVVLIIYLGMRVDTYSDDREKSFYCALSTTFFALSPFYGYLESLVWD